MSNNYIIQENIRREKQRFFINSVEIPGIQSIQGQYEQNFVPMKFVGMGVPVMVPDGVQKGSFNLNYLLISGDPFLQYTGFNGFNGYVLKDRINTSENFAFTSGYLISYNSRCSIGQIPEIGVNVAVFGNMGRLPTNESTQVTNDLNTIDGETTSFVPTIASPGSMTLNLSDFTTNRVLSYDLSLGIERNAIYPLGTREPTNVQINWPISVNLNLQYAVNDYTPKALKNSPNNPKVQHLILTHKTYNHGNTILTYRFNDLFLMKESHSAAVDGQVVIDANYVGYLGRPEG